MLREQLINKILTDAQQYIPDNKLKEFQLSLDTILENYDIQNRSTDLVVYNNFIPDCLKDYIVSRKIEGISITTLKQYNTILSTFFNTVQKDINCINTSDIRKFLFFNQQQNNCSDRTMDLKRTVICTFFKWCCNEGYITHNPSTNIKPIKYTKKPRQPLSSIEMECIRNTCTTIRDRALIEFLYSTGCRVSELTNIVKSDINFKTGEVILLGKGNKYRTSFLSDKAMYYLLSYLNERGDDIPQIFVSERKPYNPLKKCGVEYIIKTIGERANLDRALYPHLFRHTIATDCLQKGMEVTDIQSFLGHSNVTTTMVYAKIDSTDLKNKHRKITN